MTTETTTTPTADAPDASETTTTAVATNPPAETTATTTTHAATEAKTPDQHMAGFREAVAKVSEPAAAAAPAAEKKDEAKTDGTDPAAAPAAPAKEKTDDEKRAEAVETEIKTLGLKEKTAERFRELSKRPTTEEVEKQLAPLRAQAEKAEQWTEILVDSTARPEQLSSALGYLKAINSGDPIAMGKAYDVMLEEMKWLAGQLGREVPGLVDPLEAHADLKKQVDDGELPRANALEIARHRTESTRIRERDTRTAEQRSAEQRQTESVNQAIAAISALGKELRAANAAEYAAKLPLLKPHLEFAKENLAPEQWVPYVRHQYGLLKVESPAAKPPVNTSTLRPTTPATNQHPAIPKDPRAAFRMGAATAQ
jgi:hypothetical protein